MTSGLIDSDSFTSALRNVGVADSDVLTVISDFASFGSKVVDTGDRRSAMVQVHADLRMIAGANSTIVVPTFTYSTGPDSPYVHEETPSETGIYTEYLRLLPGTIRSVHPALSFAANGPRAKEICHSASPHSYGWHSVPHRVVTADSFVVSIGRSPHRGSFLLHLAEALYGVPYRYTKELSIPVYVGGEHIRAAFYHFVRWQGSDIVLDTNRLVQRLEARSIVRYAPLGQSGIWAYRARELFDATIDLLRRNIYGLLDHAPATRPWQS